MMNIEILVRNKSLLLSALFVIFQIMIINLFLFEQIQIPIKFLKFEDSSTQSVSPSNYDLTIAKHEKVFDLRRSARQNSTSNYTYGNEKHYFDPFESEANCFSEERFGFSNRYHAFSDGPKFICGVDLIAAKGKRNAEDCLVYSVGSRNKIEFETAVHKIMGCEIFMFDPTIREQHFIGVEIATFKSWALGIDGQKAMGKDGKSIETIMKELGHEGRKIDILKIDCEGCEYDIMPQLFDQMADRNITIDQIQIELHSNSGRKDKIREFFEGADKAGMRIFHKERNHWGCMGYKCAEYALVSESFLREANRAAICPFD